MPEEFDEPEGQPDDLDKPPSFFPYEDGPARRESHASGVLVEVQIEGVFAAESAGNVSRFVLLADPESGRKLPILIGPYEAQAITLPLEGTRPDRPMTHDLIRNLMEKLGGELDRIVIDDLWNTTYYAKLYIKKGAEEFEIDARPSDSLAIAVRYDAPIFVAASIFDQAFEE